MQDQSPAPNGVSQNRSTKTADLNSSFGAKNYERKGLATRRRVQVPTLRQDAAPRRLSPFTRLRLVGSSLVSPINAKVHTRKTIRRSGHRSPWPTRYVCTSPPDQEDLRHGARRNARRAFLRSPASAANIASDCKFGNTCSKRRSLLACLPLSLHGCSAAGKNLGLMPSRHSCSSSA